MAVGEKSAVFETRFQQFIGFFGRSRQRQVGYENITIENEFSLQVGRLLTSANILNIQCNSLLPPFRVGCTERTSMTKPSLLILSLGELGTNMLEAVARSDLFGTIIVASRSRAKAQERANNAIIGAGAEGFFPEIVAEELDFNTPGSAQKIRDIAADYLFTAPSMLPWWKVDDVKAELPFAGCTALHLSLMARLRDRLAEADNKAFWIGASYPDVINAVLNRTGYGPDCGIGNVQEPIAKIQRHVARRKSCAPQDVKVHLVAQHAFEYYVLNAETYEVLPPHLMKATVAGEDVTQIAVEALRQPFPFPYDLHFNRVTASAGIQALRALTSSTPVHTHLPGIGKHVGGYPVSASTGGIAFGLPPEWSLQQAITANEASLVWDGIEAVTDNGTIVFTEKTRAALHNLFGHSYETLAVETAEAQARALLTSL